MRSSSSAGSMPERSIAAWIAMRAKSKASTSTRDPLWERPIGVRAALTIKASGMAWALFSARVESDGSVQTDDLSVQVPVANQVLGQLGELCWMTETAREGNFR